MAFLELADAGHNFESRLDQADSHRAAVVSRMFLFQIAQFDELLDVVGNVGALAVSALNEVADGDLFVADVD